MIAHGKGLPWMRGCLFKEIVLDKGSILLPMRPPDHFQSSMLEELASLKAVGLERKLRVVEGIHGTRVTIGGSELINFSSNDYLGLASHPALAEAMSGSLKRWGIGATASRLICGTSAEHAALEEELAKAKGVAASLVFSSGMAAASGTIPVLVGKGDVVILDKLAHACLIDAARSSQAVIRIFPHNDHEKLNSLLRWAREKYPRGKVLIVTESVFSMEGDVAPLREIIQLKERHGAILFLDEAHAVGVRGHGAMGLAGELGLAERIDIQMGTFGKALGVSGGYIAGSRTLIDLLINRARSFIFSTAPSPAIAAACRAALRLVQSVEGEALRQRLQANLSLMASLTKIPLPQSAIVPLILGTEELALSESARLWESGFMVPAIRYPTVPRKTARIRISLSAAHDPEEIRKLSTLLNFQCFPKGDG